MLWKKIVHALRESFIFLLFNKNKIPYKEITKINKSMLPSWFPQAADIFIEQGLICMRVFINRNY